MPPSSPRVISEDGHIDTTGAVAGVYQEDEPMRLKCEVVGGKSKNIPVLYKEDVKYEMHAGRPLPVVTWWIDEQMVDDTYHSESGDTVINRLTDTKATRYVLSTMT